MKDSSIENPQTPENEMVINDDFLSQLGDEIEIELKRLGKSATEDSPKEILNDVLRVHHISGEKAQAIRKELLGRLGERKIIAWGGDPNVTTRLKDADYKVNGASKVNPEPIDWMIKRRDEGHDNY